MNTLIQTPILNSPSVRTDFDNKILVIFLGMILILVVLGILFIDLMSNFAPPPVPENNDSDNTPITIFT